jgi:hypothetical protein
MAPRLCGVRVAGGAIVPDIRTIHKGRAVDPVTRPASSTPVSLHLIKLCVGCDSVADLAEWQEERLREYRRRRSRTKLYHRTRSMPRRREEILAGGSLYWVIRGIVQVRQRIVGLEPVIGEDEQTYCQIQFDRQLVVTVPTPRQAFQGWRYLEPKDAPADLGPFDPQAGALPPAEMLADLRSLGLL